MAAVACTGQKCSQNPHPLHLFSLTKGTATLFLGVTLNSMALYGQTSSQTMHFLFNSQARHLCFKMWAVPIFAHIFSSTGSGRMAPVGHTCPHKLQRVSQGLFDGVILGLKNAEKPAARPMGCKVFEGHAFMHSPHRIHLARKSFSGNAPGGRINSAGIIFPRALSW